MRRRVRTLLIAVTALAIPLAAAAPGLGPATERVRDGKIGLAHRVMEQQKDLRAAGAISAAVDEQVPLGASCTAGFAGPYPCANVDLAAVVPLAELGGAAGNDSWGWTDPENGNEIAIVGTGTGTAFVDVTDPGSPVVLGRVESASQDSGILWRDVKVDDDHAFIVSENGGHGMQVFDLTRLREHYGSADPTRTFEPDQVDTSFGSAHNIAVNPDSDTAFIVGADVCAGGLFMIDISDPLDTEVAGCFDEDGYTHDVQCVMYEGPDADYNGTREDTEQREICFAANEDTVTIVDVTDRANPVMLNKIHYPQAAYTHQGWLTPDQDWFIFNDEVDEQAGTVDNTTTYMVDVTDLDAEYDMGSVKAYTHESLSTDHNLYVTDDGLIWEANYNQGLRILKEGADGFAAGDLDEVGYFEVDGLADAPHYGDSWNVYPFFESGTVILSNLGQGLVVLSPDYEALRGE